MRISTKVIPRRPSSSPSGHSKKVAQKEENNKNECSSQFCCCDCWSGEKEEEQGIREMAYKIVAFTAVSFSLMAILAVAICMPIVYNFVDHIQRQTKRELEFCKARKKWMRFKISGFFNWIEKLNGNFNIKKHKFMLHFFEGFSQGHFLGSER